MCIIHGMQGLSNDERKNVLGDVLYDELRAIRELVQDVPEIKRKVDNLEKDMSEVKADIKVIKKVITVHSKQIKTLQEVIK
jgi:peptidoglycan hydrolase CwlO-like protein